MKDLQARRKKNKTKAKDTGQAKHTKDVRRSYQISPADHPSNNQWHDAEDLRWAVRHWATRMNVKTPQIHLRPMTTKWASISTTGRLTLNTQLLDLPKDLGEFVIVHELTHLMAPNHGKVFKLFMDAHLPDWKERQQRLREIEKSPI